MACLAWSLCRAAGDGLVVTSLSPSPVVHTRRPQMRPIECRWVPGPTSKKPPKKSEEKKRKKQGGGVGWGGRGALRSCPAVSKAARGATISMSPLCANLGTKIRINRNRPPQPTDVPFARPTQPATPPRTHANTTSYCPIIRPWSKYTAKERGQDMARNKRLFNVPEMRSVRCPPSTPTGVLYTLRLFYGAFAL